MFVDKPPWVVHDPKCGDIYGVDVCTDGARFATAGGDHKVKIWALGPVLHASVEASTSAPRLLATLADHFGPVNAVRFSSSGRRLATGSDDKLVLVHELRAGAPRAVFGAADPPAVENWQARADSLRAQQAQRRGTRCSAALACRTRGALPTRALTRPAAPRVFACSRR